MSSRSHSCQNTTWKHTHIHFYRKRQDRAFDKGSTLIGQAHCLSIQLLFLTTDRDVKHFQVLLILKPLLPFPPGRAGVRVLLLLRGDLMRGTAVCMLVSEGFSHWDKHTCSTWTETHLSSAPLLFMVQTLIPVPASQDSSLSHSFSVSKLHVLRTSQCVRPIRDDPVWIARSGGI